MAVTANQLIKRQDGNRRSYPVGAEVVIYEGTLVFLNAAGYADDDTASGVNEFGGIAIRSVDNTGGLDGAVEIECWATGDFELVGTGFNATDLGVKVYATDNYTVSITAGGTLIGECARYVSTTRLIVAIQAGATEGLTVDSATMQTLVFSGVTGANEIQVPTNLADALSIESSAGDILVVDTTTGTVVITFGAAVRVNVAGDAQIGSATTDLVAFHGSTPTDQCGAYTQTFATAERTHAARTAVDLTDSSAGTPADTIAALADGSTYANDVAAIRSNFASLARAVDRLIVDLADTASVVNAVVDDLQEKGLVG